MTPAPPDVSVVIPCHAAARTVAPLLEALQRQTLEQTRFEVIVVDPAADGTHRVLQELAAGWSGPALRIVRGPLHDGPAAKRNLGASLARGRVLAFTDSDCVPEPAWLEAGLAAVERGSELVQGAVIPPADAAHHPLSHRIHVMSDVGLHETSNMFYVRGLFEQLGGFTTRYFRRFGAPFGEDAELGWRARRSGARYSFELEAVVQHPVGAPSLRGHLREQWLARAFPQLVRDVPELREALLYRRWFLTPRSAAALAAALGGVAALGGARARRALLVGALTALPYGRLLAVDLRRAGTQQPRELAGLLAANAVSDLALLMALAWGSVRSRCVVI
ncbi:MAG: glycosyltransferase family 2 protein [Thermoleophilaceae bacterium]